MKKLQFNTDSTVSNEDGIAWFEELIQRSPVELAAQLADLEPAVAGTAIEIARRTRRWLKAVGASGPVIDYTCERVVLAGVLCAEMQRRGHYKLWRDLFEVNDAGEPKGGTGNG